MSCDRLDFSFATKTTLITKVHTIFSYSGKVDEKATQLHAIASLKVLLDATKPQDGINGTGGGAATGDLAQDSGRASQGTEVIIITFDSPLSSTTKNTSIKCHVCNPGASINYNDLICFGCFEVRAEKKILRSTEKKVTKNAILS